MPVRHLRVAFVALHVSLLQSDVTRVDPMASAKPVEGSIPDMAASMSPSAENVTGAVIPEAGHFIPEEQPDATVDALTAFIDHAPAG